MGRKWPREARGWLSKDGGREGELWAVTNSADWVAGWMAALEHCPGGDRRWTS